MPDQLLRIPAPDRLHVQKSLVVNMRNDETDLITMCVHENSSFLARVFTGDDVSVGIRCNLVRDRSQEIAHHLLDTLFVARGSGSLEELVEQFFREIVHG